MDKFANRLSMRFAALALVIPAMCVIGPMNSALASPPIHRLTLDLQLPANATTTVPANVEKPSAPFPSMHRLAQWAETPSQPRGWSAAEPATRTPGRVEELALRFHREGLPLARLWETKSALVSLGLNPKGKPGLWLTQKTH
jgi:hypothetical protein